MQLGNEEYPPIPKIIEGLLKKRVNKDFNIANIIKKKEISKLIGFFLFNGEEDILISLIFW